MQNKNNLVRLKGKINNIKFSHKVGETDIYEGFISVERTSGTLDLIPVNFRKPMLELVKEGEDISVIGEFRSRNNVINGKTKLELYVMPTYIVDDDDVINQNVIEIEGYICKEPIFRVTPLKREITDLIIAVNRQHNKSDYLPVIVWGLEAKVASNYKVGDKVKIKGRVQSRIYQKDGENKTAYEVSVTYISKIEESEEV